MYYPIYVSITRLGSCLCGFRFSVGLDRLDGLDASVVNAAFDEFEDFVDYT
jgi:hypothetical protein